MGMPINSVSSGSALQASGANNWQQRRQDFQALSQALQSGNLGAAQQAFSSLSSSFPAGVANDPNSLLAKLGQALQSGNLSAAQSAFSAMCGHHHHHGGGLAQASAPTTSTAAVLGSIGSNINVQA